MNPKSMPCGGPAFPRAGFSGENGFGKPEDGMTLRDYFAAQAIQGATTGGGGLPDSNYCQLIAKRAYDLADAMLAAR